MTRDLRMLLVSALLSAALGASVAVFRNAEPVPTAGVLTYDEGGFRYTYEVLTGAECLFDLHDDPDELRNLATSHASQVHAMRRALETRLHVDDLDRLRKRDGDAEAIRRLHSLGYL